MVDSCLREFPRDRPIVSQLLNIMVRLMGRHHNIIEDILNQLIEHAQNLESVVAARTTDLLAEMVKVDKLLEEILPV